MDRPAQIAGAPPGEVGLPRLVGRLLDDGKTVVHAEIAVFKAKAAERATAYKGAAIFFAAAAVLALAGFIALLVGLILALATLVGPGWATLIVVGLVFATAGFLAYVGSGKLAPPPSPGREA